MTSERGFALIAVMLVLALLAVVVTEFAFSARLEASMVLPGQTTPLRLPALPRTRVGLGPGEFSYRISDEAARISVNGAGPDRLERLLAALEVERAQRDIIKDSLLDWRDTNELHRVHGAESDFYLRLPVPYRSRNGNIQDVSELLQIRGVTRELYVGMDGRPGLGDLVTALGVTAVNLNTAGPLVLKALGLSDAEIADVVRTRVRAPYPSVPGRFAGRGFTVGSSSFRIEAEGVVAGVARRRVVAVVQRGADQQSRLDVTIVSWRPGDDE